MQKNLFIDASHPHETRVVLKSGDDIEEYEYENKNSILIKSNIYLGKVSRVEPSLQAAFLDIGRERHGFLAFNDIQSDYYQLPQGDIQNLKKKEEQVRETLREESKKFEENFSYPAKETDHSNGENEIDKNKNDTNNQKFDFEDKKVIPNTGREETDISSKKIINTEKKFHALGQRFGLKRYKIQEVIKPNQIILVQVLKDERGQKGAALTTFISLAGKYTVLMPNTPKGGGISRKIFNTTDRKKIRNILNELSIPKAMGLIVRTAGSNKTQNEINYDLELLIKMWDEIKKKALDSLAPSLVHVEGDIIKRTIRDIYSKDTKNIIVEGNDGYQKAKNFMKLLMPENIKYIKKYRGKIPLFYKEEIEKKLNEIFESTIKLKSGGYIVIHPTEALVSIDVNSGKFTKEINVERTALATNLEATNEIARQIKIRDLSGLIIIDFIDMMNFNNKRIIERELREKLRNDRARIHFGKISNFGLLEISRQRLRESSVQWNMVLTLDSFSFKILKLAEEQSISNKIKNVKIIVSEQVGRNIIKKFNDELSYCKKRHNLQIDIVHDNSLIIPEYKIQLLRRNKKIVKTLEHKIEDQNNIKKNKFYSNNNKKKLNRKFRTNKKFKPYKKYNNKKKYPINIELKKS